MNRILKLKVYSSFNLTNCLWYIIMYTVHILIAVLSIFFFHTIKHCSQIQNSVKTSIEAWRLWVNHLIHFSEAKYGLLKPIQQKIFSLSGGHLKWGVIQCGCGWKVSIGYCYATHHLYCFRPLDGWAGLTNIIKLLISFSAIRNHRARGSSFPQNLHFRKYLKSPAFEISW